MKAEPRHLNGKCSQLVVLHLGHNLILSQIILVSDVLWRLPAVAEAEKSFQVYRERLASHLIFDSIIARSVLSSNRIVVTPRIAVRPPSSARKSIPLAVILED